MKKPYNYSSWVFKDKFFVLFDNLLLSNFTFWNGLFTEFWNVFQIFPSLITNLPLSFFSWRVFLFQSYLNGLFFLCHLDFSTFLLYFKIKHLICHLVMCLYHFVQLPKFFKKADKTFALFVLIAFLHSKH